MRLWLHNSVTALKTIKFHTLNMWIVWYMIYISIKLLFFSSIFSWNFRETRIIKKLLNAFREAKKFTYKGIRINMAFKKSQSHRKRQDFKIPEKIFNLIFILECSHSSINSVLVSYCYITNYINLAAQNYLHWPISMCQEPILT